MKICTLSAYMDNLSESKSLSFNHDSSIAENHGKSKHHLSITVVRLQTLMVNQSIHFNVPRILLNAHHTLMPFRLSQYTRILHVLQDGYEKEWDHILTEQ